MCIAFSSFASLRSFFVPSSFLRFAASLCSLRSRLLFCFESLVFASTRDKTTNYGCRSRTECDIVFAQFCLLRVFRLRCTIHTHERPIVQPLSSCLTDVHRKKNRHLTPRSCIKRPPDVRRVRNHLRQRTYKSVQLYPHKQESQILTTKREKTYKSVQLYRKSPGRRISPAGYPRGAPRVIIFSLNCIAIIITTQHAVHLASAVRPRSWSACDHTRTDSGVALQHEQLPADSSCCTRRRRCGLHLPARPRD